MSVAIKISAFFKALLLIILGVSTVYIFGQKDDLKYKWHVFFGSYKPPHTSRDFSNESELLPKILFDSALTGPQKNIDIPGNAIILHPEDDILTIVQNSSEGEVFYFTKGTYRIGDIKPKSSMKFIGEYGAVMSGAELLSGFRPAGDYWKVQYQRYILSKYEFDDECADNSPRCNCWVDLYVDDVPLHHVNDIEKVDVGSWYYDFEDGDIYLGFDPESKKVEISKRRAMIAPPRYDSVAGVEIRNLVIEKYASRPQHGAIHPGENSVNWKIENNIIQLNHGTGIRLTDNMTIKRNLIHKNGQMGVGGVGDKVIFEKNELSENNFANYKWEWEAGGSKFAVTDGLVVRHNYVHGNNGPGLWTDIDNRNTLYEYNLVENNKIGILHEISFSAIIRHNIVRNNHERHFAQIWVSNAGPVEIYQNEIVVPSGAGSHAILIHNYDRGEGSYGEWLSNDTYVHHNNINFLGHSGLIELRVGDDYKDRFVDECWYKSDDNKYYMPKNSAMHFNCSLYRKKLLANNICDIGEWRKYCELDKNSSVVVVD